MVNNIFSNQILLKLIDCFVLVYSYQDSNRKRFETRRFYLAKGIIKNNNVSISDKNFYNQPIDSHVKRYEEITKLTTRPSEDYVRWRLLDYGCIKNPSRLIAVDWSRQKQLDTDPKAIEQK